MEVSSQHGEGLRDSVEQLLADASAQGLVEDATDRRQPRSGEGVLAAAPRCCRRRRSRKAARSSTTSRCRSRRCRDFLEEASRGGQSDRSGLPAGAVRPSRRRQHPLQRQPAGRRRHARSSSRAGTRSTTPSTRSCCKYGGSISAEHGIGELKRDSLPKVKDPVALELMRGLKRMLDPQRHPQSGQGALARHQNSDACPLFVFLALGTRRAQPAEPPQPGQAPHTVRPIPDYRWPYD